MANPWEKYGAAPQGVIPLGPRDTSKDQTKANEAERIRMERIRLMADLESKGLTLDASGNVVPMSAASTPGDPNKTGEEYLATLPPELRHQVKLLSDGRMPFPTGPALRSPKVQQLIAAAAQYDPTLDAANAATRVATRKNFTSGKARANITSMNTALGHLGTLKQAADDLNNSSIPAWNRAANWAISQQGDPRVKKFTVARDAVASELVRVFRGSGGALADIEEWKNNIDAAGSPEQLDAAIRQGVTLLNSRLEAMGDEYKAGMGKSTDPLEMLNPHAQEVFTHLGPGGDGKLPGKGGGGPNPFGGFPSNGGGQPGLYDGAGRFIGVDPRDPLGQYRPYMVFTPEGKIAPAGYNGRAYNWRGQDLGYDAEIGMDQEKSFSDGGLNVDMTPLVPAGEDVPNLPNKYEQDLQAQVKAAGADNPKSAENWVMRGANGTLSGLSDELNGATAALKYGVQGYNPATAYTLARDAERMRQHQNDAGQGAMGTAVDIAGSLPTAFLMGGGTGVRGAMANGMRYGAARGYGEGSGATGSALSAVGGAVGGAAGGGIGGVLGKYAVAPVARRAANTETGKYLLSLLSRGRFEPVPNPTPFEGAINKINPNIENVRTNLQSADELGVPYSLADADPRLRLLAGNVSRATPEARAMAEGYLEPRNLGQVDRFRSAVEQNFAKPVDIAARGSQLKGLASSQSRPLYEEAFAKNQPAWSERIQQFIDDPLSKPAIAKSLEAQRLEALAAGQKFDPAKFSVTGFDDAGNPILSKTPTLRTVDAIRQGYGHLLDDLPRDIGGNPIHTSRSRAIAMNKDALTKELDDLTARAGNRAYGDARQTYGTYMGMKNALETGFKMEGNSTPAREVASQVGKLTDNQMPEFQSGYATSLIDRANKQRFTANPWEANMGTPNQQELLRTVFPQGVGNVGKQYGLERDMAKTAMEALGGSQTAARQSIDQAFRSPMAQATVDVAGHGMTGIPGLGTLTSKMGGLLARSRVDSVARKNAEQLAPLLFNNASDVNALGLIEAMLSNNAARKAAADAAARKIGLFGAAASGPRR